MKFSLAVIATFAASVSAIRIIHPETTPQSDHSLSGLLTEIHIPTFTSDTPLNRPCHGHGHGKHQPIFDPIKSLLSSLGIVEAPYNPLRPKHQESINPPTTPDDGLYRILPFIPEGIIEIQDDRAQYGSRGDGWKALEGKNGVKAHHHRGGQADRASWTIHEGTYVHHEYTAPDFMMRLNNALQNLEPHEALALAFVWGAGMGSIVHFFFMLCLITIRAIRGRHGSTREERRAARRARRQARREGRIRLENEDALPGYIPVQGVDVNEKA